MANIQPFRPYRYTARAGDPAKLVTQPYDKINPAMRAKYLAASPYNLVRIILGERKDGDGPQDNVYTRASASLNEWIADGYLAQDAAPSLQVYSQEFTVPDSDERATRIGFIGLGKIEDYSANVVYRHEHTLSGPKQDRLELLRHTRGHFGQIFMLYPDPQGAIDKILEQAASGTPVLDVTDDYGARHRVWPIADPNIIAAIQTLMAGKKLLIADGHHRYETALAYRNEHPEDPAAQFVMMTLVNMYSPGLRILATHRVLRNLSGFDLKTFVEQASKQWSVTSVSSLDEIRSRITHPDPQEVRIGLVTGEATILLSRPRQPDELDVPILHTELLGGLLGISEADVREQKYITYVRGIDAAVAEVREHGAQAAFLLEPTPIDEMARIAFGGGVMPQKSTDFYPKLLSGVTIYKL